MSILTSLDTQRKHSESDEDETVARATETQEDYMTVQTVRLDREDYHDGQRLLTQYEREDRSKMKVQLFLDDISPVV